MQKQLNADTETLRDQNDPERKSKCDPCVGRESHDEKDEKTKDGNDQESDSRRTHRRVSDNAEISHQSHINEPHRQPSQHAECGAATKVARDKSYDRCHHRHKSEKE